MKLAASKPVKATTMKNSRMASLISTITAFVVADSRVPRISKTAHITTSRTGGRLNWPGWNSAPFGPDTIMGVCSAAGICQPIALVRKLFR